ncbi:hypothetical protein MGN70_004690 [Eutypa lata]|nr:hypothetical protein MGN70_004690 [Eutypa lata]
MSGSSQKDQSKVGKSFDTGSTNALPSVDLASGIFEAHSATQPAAQPSKPALVTGGPLDKQAAVCTVDSIVSHDDVIVMSTWLTDMRQADNSTSNSRVQDSSNEVQEMVNSDGSISRKPKDTDGAGAMIL